MNLNLSIVNISYYIVELLKQKRVLSYDNLYRALCTELKEDSIIELFNLSLTFLYSFNVIHYNKHSDCVELLPNENFKNIFE